MYTCYSLHANRHKLIAFVLIAEIPPSRCERSYIASFANMKIIFINWVIYFSIAAAVVIFIAAATTQITSRIRLLWITLKVML